jgi:hypothetical protein
MEADDLTSNRIPPDAQWSAHHARLDTSLMAAIRPPVVDGRFDEQVWALIRADEAKALATRALLPTKVGTPWWLDLLNVVAIAVTAVTVVLALGASRPAAETAAVALALVEQPSESGRLFALVASAAALWLGLRQVPFVRALVRAWL